MAEPRVHCPACGQANREDARFCDACGSSLARRCPRCGAEIRAAARFCDACGQVLLDAPAAPAPAGAMPAEPALAPAPAHPGSFCADRYRVIRFLGEGGKKRVYLTHDTRLDRDVAFALLRTEGLDTESTARLRREAQAMGRLGDHPHIVPVYDMGEEEGQPYLVSQFMSGGSLAERIETAEGHRLPLPEAARIAQEVCQALEHAHRHGIVHRDLKPGNVWLAEGGSTKLGDFGLAVALDRSRLTQAGMMVGTAAYMPPEQAIGGSVEPRSDLYSLGAMLYEMATGRPPFIGEETVAVITQHLNTPPVTPSWHRPEVPPALETLVLRLLEKDPAKRPASAAEVRQMLAGIDLSPAPSPAPGGVDGGVGPIYRRIFVGREGELRLLQRAFDATLSGEGALTLVVGEPGIGKTALCEQLATYVAIRGGRTLVGHSYEPASGGSLPYLAFVEALRSYVLARPPEALREELGTGAAEVARIVSEVRERVPVELRPPGDPEEDRWRLLQAVAGFLRSAASVQPILLVLEDLHWADRGTLDLLLHVARNLAGARLLVVGTYRDVEVDRAHPLSAALAELRRAGDWRRVLLRGLTPDEVHRMVNSITGQEVRWSLAEAIHRQTEGNPLFIQEVLRYLVEEGLIRREGGRWRRAGEAAPEVSIPEGLRDVIGRRLSRLSPECNQVLSIAAIIGRDFDLETLRRVADTEEEKLLEGMEEARRVGILEERTRPGSVQYRFAHAFFQQTLYEELIAPRRLRLHQLVARALEAQYRARLEDHAAELAEHFSHSTDPADLAKAVGYGELGARRASAVHAYGQAVRLLEQALQVQEVVDPGDKGRLCELLLALAEAVGPAGEPQRAFEELAPQAFALAEGLADQQRCWRAARVALEGLSRSSAGLASATEAWRQWAERADRYAAPGTVGRVQADLALSVLQAGAPAGKSDLNRRALDLALQVGDPETLFDAARQHLQGLGAPEDQEERLRVAEEFVALSREGASARTQSRFLWQTAFAFLTWGQRDRAEELWRQQAELATRTGDANAVLYPIFNQATLATLDGQLEAALAASGALADRAEELGAPTFGRVSAALTSFRPLLYLGRAGDILDEAVFLTVRNPRRALALAFLGRGEEAGRTLAEALAESLAYEGWGALPLSALLEAATLVEDRRAAEALLSRLDGCGPLLSVFTDLTCVARHLGAAAALLGRPEEARAHYHTALELAARARFRPELALTRLQLAELLLSESQVQGPKSKVERSLGQEALEHLDFAIAEFRAMKMQAALERALRHKSLLTA